MRTEIADGLATVIVGLFGGAGATLIWETAVKPSRDRRAFAQLLRTELAINRGIIKNQIAAHSGNPTLPPPKGVRLYTTVFDASASRLSDLPIGVAALTYWAYRYF